MSDTSPGDGMIRTSSPTVWRRWLAFELRSARTAAGRSQRDVGKEFGWSGVRISYIENAQQNVTEDDLAKLLPFYEVPENRWPGYHEAAERSREKGWWERYDPREVPEWMSLQVGLEQGASLKRAFEPQVIPGLLQIPDYAAAVIQQDVVPRTRERLARLVELRAARQEVITRQTDPLTFSVVVDEAALRRIATNNEVMSAQLAHLAAMAERPNVTVQVLPFSHGVHGYAFGAFTILGFPWRTDPGVVYVENRSGAVYLEEPHEIEAHALVFEHLCVLALPPDESIEMILNTAKDYK